MRLALLVLTACSGGSSTVQNKQLPPDPPAPELACEVNVDEQQPLSLVLLNSTSAPRTVHYFRPYMQLELTVTDRSGNRRTIEQPAIDMPVEPAQLVVPPRGRATLDTPIRLRFATDAAAAASLFTWVISGDRAPATYDVKLRLDGDKTVLTCRVTK